jgi:hypothetical protein
MKAFISKSAWAKGILEIDATECGDGMIKNNDNAYMDYFHGTAKEWHKTREAAVARAEEMRKKQIASLKKKITKLEKMTF